MPPPSQKSATTAEAPPPPRRSSRDSVAVSVVVPFWNEEGNLTRLTEELSAAMATQTRSFEVLLVDDGSTDGSPNEARAAAIRDPRIRLVQLRRHSGKSAALAAGRDLSSGQVLVTLDADLQDPPSAVPAFLDAIDSGAEVVAARRDARQEPWHRRAASCAFNRVMGWLTGVPIRDMNAGLKAYRRATIESIHLSRGMHRFLAVFAHARGSRITELPVDHAPRHSGRTKYGWWRYVETVIGIAMVLVIAKGPDHAMRVLVRAGAAAALLGATALLIGWWISSPLVLISGTIGLLLGVQLLVSRLVSEILFQFVLTSGTAPPPYELIPTEADT